MLPQRPISAPELPAQAQEEEAFGATPVDPADPLRLVLPVAWVGLVASIAGRAIGQALHGAGHGLDTFIAYFDLGADFATFSFAILALVTTSLQLVHTARESRLGFLHRTFVIAFGAIVVALATPTVPLRLPERGLLIVAVSSALVALAGARQGLLSARTRALGFVLGAVGLAALLHLAALILSISPLPTMIALSRSLGTASIFWDGLSLVVAFTWLSTRNRHRISWPVTIALSLAVIVYWGARKGHLEDAAVWQVVAARAVSQLTSAPASFVLPDVQQLLELTSLALAGAALFVRGQATAVKASLSLLLLARPMTDVPLSAIAVTLAALTTGLGAVGEKTAPKPSR